MKGEVFCLPFLFSEGDIIKAIETEYNGYKFRSRLEAKWAVFFDLAGIKYEYEPEGYKQEDGAQYLPDFYLPDANVYAEVKGQWQGWEDDIKRMSKFLTVDSPFRGILILTDIPLAKAVKGTSNYWYPMLFYDPLKDKPCITKVLFREYADGTVKLAANLEMSDWHKTSVKEFLYSPAYENFKPVPDTKINLTSSSIKSYPFMVCDASYTPKMDAAYQQARQARF